MNRGRAERKVFFAIIHEFDEIGKMGLAIRRRMEYVIGNRGKPPYMEIMNKGVPRVFLERFFYAHGHPKEDASEAGGCPARE